MRGRIIGAALWVLLSVTLGAQVTVEVDFDKEDYIANETMYANVRITNFSGRTLNFGKDNHWLLLTVEGRDGFLVDQTGTPNVKGEFEVPNAARATRRVNIGPYFDMATLGTYQVQATVFCEQLKEVLKSPKAKINTIHATTLWKKDFGVTLEDGKGYEVRTYSLIRALNNNRLELYVRVATRDASKVFGVFSIGNLVSFGNPEVQLDRFSRMHLLQQYEARSFRYIVVTPDGELMTRHRYDYTGTRPKLSPAGNNLVRVAGGIRVPMDDDLPPSKETFESLGLEPPKDLGKTEAPDPGANLSSVRAQ
jgi:hypothetical protein